MLEISHFFQYLSGNNHAEGFYVYHQLRVHKNHFEYSSSNYRYLQSVFIQLGNLKIIYIALQAWGESNFPFSVLFLLPASIMMLSDSVTFGFLLRDSSPSLDEEQLSCTSRPTILRWNILGINLLRCKTSRHFDYTNSSLGPLGKKFQDSGTRK